MKKLFVFRAVCCALALTITLTEARSMDETQTLNARQRGIVTIAAFTANGDLEKLKPALHDGLEAGLTVNEIKEVLVQLYAYTGFPRSLNGIGVFMAVMDERKARGIRDEEGREPSPLPRTWTGTPTGPESGPSWPGGKAFPRLPAISSLRPPLTPFSSNICSRTFLPATIWTIRAGNWRLSRPWPPCRALARSCASISARP